MRRGNNANRILLKLHIGAMIITLITAFGLVRGMNVNLPIHVDLLDNATREGSRVLFFIIPGTSFVFLPFALFLYFKLSKRADTLRLITIYQVLLLLIQIAIFFITVHFGIIFQDNIKNSIYPIILIILMSIFFIACLYVHPYFNRDENLIYGFITNFTVTTRNAWKIVNKFLSLSGMTLSIIAILISLITFKFWNIFLLILVAATFGLTKIYHDKIKKQYLADNPE